MVAPQKTENLSPLKGLMPLHPWRTRSPPLSGLQGVQFVKLKEPVIKDGVRIFWQLEHREANDPDVQIPYEWVFEFVDKYIIKKIKRWLDRRVGGLLGLPRPEITF